jgi:hypothetical protein
MSTKVVVVRDGKALKLVEVETNVRAQNYVIDAPNGFSPGDERFVNETPEGVVFDFVGIAKATNFLGGSATEVSQSSQKAADGQSILARFRRGYFKP